MSEIGNKIRTWMGQNDREPAPQAQTQPQNPDPNAQRQKDTNAQNDGINDDDVDAIWKEVQKKPADTQQQNQQQQQFQQPAPKEPGEQVKDYMKSIGLEPVALTGGEIELLKSGDPDGVNQIFGNLNNRIQKAHIESVKATQKMIENVMPKMIEEAVAKSKGFVEGKELRGLLNQKFEWSKDPALGPVAETIMQRFLDRGASRDEALQGVDKWAQKMVKAYDPSFTPNTNGEGGYKQRTPHQPGGDVDWMATLKG